MYKIKRNKEMIGGAALLAVSLLGSGVNAQQTPSAPSKPQTEATQGQKPSDPAQPGQSASPAQPSQPDQAQPAQSNNASGPSAQTTQTAGTGDIVETIGKADNFKTLAAAIGAAGLTDALKGPGPYTLFAPTDEAFAKLPAGTLDNLLKPENKEKLKTLLSYHVVSGKESSADIAKLKDAKTLQGSNLKIDTASGVKIGNASVTQPDMMASNGVIHGIDTVLMPSGSGASSNMDATAPAQGNKSKDKTKPSSTPAKP